jgi:uncharacterized membrane protein
MFVFPLIADRGVSVGDAFRASWQASQGRFWWLFLFYVLTMLIMQVGVAACYVGVLATTPIAVCMIASAYRECFPPTGEAMLVR